MVGAIMAASSYSYSYSREKLQGLARSAKSATDLPPKLHRLRNLRRNLQGEASVFPAELLPLLFDLLSDQFGAARKFVAQILGEVGLNYVELLPEIVPLFIKSLQDDTPAVVRQVIASASALFRSTLHKFALQGLHSSELDELLQSSWTWMLKLKDEICSLAFKQGNSGVKLCAMKFVEALILLYTPDPSLSLDSQDFNISILRGGHPVLNIGDLSIEASQKLGSLLDQLRHPAAKSLNSIPDLKSLHQQKSQQLLLQPMRNTYRMNLATGKELSILDLDILFTGPGHASPSTRVEQPTSPSQGGSTTGLRGHG